MPLIIERVTDEHGNPIANGGETTSSKLTLSGKTTQANQQLEIKNGETLITQSTSDGNSNWDALARGLASGQYAFYAQAGNETSARWQVTVN
ncbi:hypothetical protein [Pseudomonas poae]|uniref:Bacterial Ig-like domain-containing protein n=1 Tax=Pseudomonas poae TaxID=200451 RepID=A0A2S9EXN4_9PSED|nr:hypothetical protein [Pseudomonas poae]PRA29809.1 hypothetical protein CQZ97_12560 [Pseudomonas poae]PRC21790.1 hypothetical protein CQZ99_03050 [Pseudomonas poae]